MMKQDTPSFLLKKLFSDGKASVETVQILSWTEYSAFTKVFSIVPFSEHACFEGFLPICSYGCSFPVHFRHHLFCGVSIFTNF